jgi:hypothetical protein
MRIRKLTKGEFMLIGLTLLVVVLIILTIFNIIPGSILILILSGFFGGIFITFILINISFRFMDRR